MRKTIVSVVSLLAISLIALASCSEPQQNIPGTASISVRVSDNTYAKTITPEDNVNISHYVITVVNEIEGIEQSSGYLTKGSMFTVSNVPAGIWYAKVDAYIDRGNDTYVKVASDQSEPQNVAAGVSTTFTLVLDTLDEVASGDVTVTLKMPVELSSQGKVFWYQYTITGVTNEEFTHTSKLLSGKTGTDAQATIKLDADTLGLMQGAYRFEITIQDKETSPILIKKGVDVMRLVNGLEATGTIDLSSYEPDQSFDVTITDKVGDIIIPTLKEDKMLYSLAMHNGSASLTVTLAEPLKSNEVIEWYIDGELDETVNTDEVSSGKYTFLFNAPGNHSVVAIVRDLDTLMSVGSIGFNVVLIEFSEQLFSFSLNSDKESYTVEGLVKAVGEFKMPESGVLEIPATYKGKPVTKIEYEAFSGRKDIVGSVVIPDSVISIGTSAFAVCSALTSINIPDSVTSIGNYAFQHCSSLVTVEISETSQLESIGERAFQNCYSLTSIDIPDSVTFIEKQVFAGCSALTRINIPDSVTFIGDYAFYDCSVLTSINIPDSVTSIGEYAFNGCSALESINIPDGVTEIGERAFEDCSALTEITIPEGVTSIGLWTFRSCSALTDIYCEAAEQPEGWHVDWLLGCNAEVHWGYTGE